MKILRKNKTAHSINQIYFIERHFLMRQDIHEQILQKGKNLIKEMKNI